MEEEDEELEGTNFEDIGESICAICDDGGNLLCCDGPCMRSFHATKSTAAESTSKCRSLGLDDFDVIRIQKYFCPNCKYKQHQCFACSQLGRSEGPQQEVFMCDVALCGRFYHLGCVPQGRPEGFTCPLHKCYKCGQRETFEDEEGRLYPCRRCPRAWHRRCARPTIKFDNEGHSGVRGWLIGESRFLYCTRHPIIVELNTPSRNHLEFPRLKNKEFGSARPAQPGTRRGLLPGRDTGYADGSTLFSASGKRKFSDIQTSVPRLELPKFRKEEVEEAIESIIQRTSRQVSYETIAVKLTAPSTVSRTANTHVQSGKIESLLRAFKKASDCLSRGGSVEEAQCLFPPQHLKQFEKLKDSLRVYLSPALHGKRYSSFGRHFTHITKLQQIVDMLSCYVEPGDTVMDFCCGSNDFSRLMSRRLEETGKACFFRNFDIIQPEDTFNFQKRDYMTVSKQELPAGDKLIIGLNPPFGVHAQTASKFVEHSASFSPKIIIIIAPPETRSPGHAYELIWRDETMLRGPVFYLPGSIDVHGKRINQDNNVPPFLSFWSRKEWVRQHRRIALERGHLQRRFPVLDGI